MGRSLRFSLPLLAKELLDLSARRSTYSARVIYAFTLLCIFLFLWYSLVASGRFTLLNVLGLGRTVMASVGALEQIGLHLLLPIFCCGVFTVEKERNTLGLLFLTRLGPWTILIEKLGSRMLLAGSYLLIGVPIHAFGYALGGISVELLIAHTLNLLATSLSIISTCIVCSAWCRTTTASLVATYALIFLPRLLAVSMPGFFFGRFLGRSDDVLGFCLLGFNWVWFASVTRVPLFASGFWVLAILLLPAALHVIYSLVCLTLARRFLVTRSTMPPRSRILNCLRLLDRKLSGDHSPRPGRLVVVWHEEDRLPDETPVAWRETRRYYLPTARRSVWRLLVLVQTLVMLLMVPIYLELERDYGLPLIRRGAWGGLLLMSAVFSIGLVSSERAKLTLDVLLTTLLPSRDFIRQKLSAVSQIIWICESPLWALAIMEYMDDLNLSRFLLRATMLLIYPRLVVWTAMSYSLSSKSTVVAMVKTVLDLSLRCLVPTVVYSVLVMILFQQGVYDIGSFSEAVQFQFEFLQWLNPLLPLAISDFAYGGDHLPIHDLAATPWIMLAFNTLIHGGLLLFVRHRCLSRADRLLGRQPASVSPRLGVPSLASDADAVGSG